MAETEYFKRGKNKTIHELKEIILYYVLEYFLDKEFKNKNYEIYMDYILPIFERDNYIHLFDDNQHLSIRRKDYLFYEIDESKIPSDLYQYDYTNYILEKYNTEVVQILSKIEFLTEKSPSLYRTIDFDFLQDKYFNNIPQEIYLTLCNFPKIQFLIMRMKDANYQVFLNTIKKMQETYSMLDIITNLVLIIGVCERGNINIEDVKDIDYDLFTNIIFNDFNVKYDLGIPKKEVNIFEYYKNQTIKGINSDDRLEMINSVLILKYGLTLREVKSIFKDGNELLKNDNSSFFDFYNDVLEIEKMSKEDLIKLYNSITNTSVKNYYLCKKYMRNINLQLYNRSLIKVDSGINEFELEDDFNMIVHVTGAFSVNNHENYYESWNRDQTTSMWMCCSYISNELICVAPFNEKSVCYGFNAMEDDSLLYYSTEDMASETNSIEQRWSVSDSENILPNDMINNTRNNSNIGYFNEMNFARIQAKKKKNPDYIIMFRNNNEFVDEKKCRKAQADFGNIPIVIIDVDKMLQKSMIKFQLLIDEYAKTNDENLIGEMYRIANNCAKTCYNWNKTDNFFLSNECQNFIYNYNRLYLNNVENTSVQINKGNVRI